MLTKQLQQARCADPYVKLGFINNPAGPGYLLRIWSPDAISVIAINMLAPNQSFDMERVAAEGLFECVFADLDKPFPVELDITNEHDRYQQVYPYQFEQIARINVHHLYQDITTAATEMGARLRTVTLEDGRCLSGVRFAVYAPNATAVSVIGDFNYWDGRYHPLQRLDNGCWVLFVPGVGEGSKYKFEIKDPLGNRLPHKVDPYGFYAEQYPSHSSIIFDHGRYQWQDSEWIEHNLDDKRYRAMSIYEVHLGSWRHIAEGEERTRSMTYLEMADVLVPYVKEMGFTHIEIMPVSEHPFAGSWGYQPVGLFAPTSRFGNPDEFKAFVDRCHQAGIGVIMDWVPAHFPDDSHGLARFDGTHLYEYADPRKGWHPDWNSCIYDFGRDHVRQFLVANALFWLEYFHLDGLRVDAVASMLYLDYSRKSGEWLPNVDGGNENYEAISLLRWFNEEVYKRYPHAMTIAEESTAFPGVSRPTFTGGLGFGFKWNMGWMHDSLEYMTKDPAFRKYHHGEMTFSMVYAYDENFILPLSHDEVVHGKGSILYKMPGDEWQQAANARAYFGFMFGHPGKKLNFMGNELAQGDEWNHDVGLQWFLLDYPKHKGMQQWFKDLNHVYQSHHALYEMDVSYEGFEWVELEDSAQSIFAFVRKAKTRDQEVIVVSNLTPVPREHYRLGVNKPGHYRVLLNSDDERYWGSNYPVSLELDTEPKESHGRKQSLLINLPPLATLFLQRDENTDD